VLVNNYQKGTANVNAKQKLGMEEAIALALANGDASVSYPFLQSPTTQNRTYLPCKHWKFRLMPSMSNGACIGRFTSHLVDAYLFLFGDGFFPKCLNCGLSGVLQAIKLVFGGVGSKIAYEMILW